MRLRVSNENHYLGVYRGLHERVCRLGDCAISSATGCRRSEILGHGTSNHRMLAIGYDSHEDQSRYVKSEGKKGDVPSDRRKGGRVERAERRSLQ
jgi:hypothetical protein